MKRPWLFSLAALLVGSPAVSAAQSNPGRVLVPADELEVRWVPDLALTASMVGVAILLEQAREGLADDLSCPGRPEAADACSPSTINPIDRWATGLGSETAATLSDALLVTSLSMPLVFAGLDMTSDRQSPELERFGKDTLVIAQTYASAYLLTNIMKVLARRLRPFNYDPRFVSRRRDGDSRLSFPSGHTSMAFAGAATLSVLLDQRFPGEEWAIGAAMGGFAVASAVGVSRVLAGRHFPTDVLVGAAIGTTLGLLVPRFHRGPGEPSSAPRGVASSPVVFGIGGRF